MKPKQRYRLKDGTVCVGTTTVVGNLGWNKNVLINWANRLGREGVDSKKYVDDKASIGTLAHSLILADLKKEEVDLKDFTQNQIDKAKNCLKSYYSWRGTKVIVPLIIEEMLVHEDFGYGGTPDFFGFVDDVPTLIDYKTGSGGIYAEHKIQVAAYCKLVETKKHSIKEVRILNIPRGEDESFTEKFLTETELKAGWNVFLHLLEIHKLKYALTKDN